MNFTTSTASPTELEEILAKWGAPIWEVSSDLMLLRILIFVWISAALAVGVPGNILTIGLIMFVKDLRQRHHVFFANLALCDFGVMIMDVFVLLGAVYGRDFYLERPMLCEISGFICMMSCFGSLWTMMFIAINRYVCILHNEHYDKLFGTKGTVISMIILWTCVILLDLPNWPLLGFGLHAFSDFGMHCTFAITSNVLYNTVMYTGLAVVFPAIVIFFCYLNILIRTSRAANKFSQVSKRRQTEQKQLTISLITIYGLFCLTWLPMGVLVFSLGIGRTSILFNVPLSLLLVNDMWAHTNSAINSVVLGTTHSGFRKAYGSLFGKICGLTKA